MLEGEKVLSNRLEESNKKLADLSEKKDNMISKLDSKYKDEELNPYGIKRDSTFEIKEIQGNNLRKHDGSSLEARLRVHCAKEYKDTEFRSNGSDYAWEELNEKEDFKFEIREPNTSLKVEVIDVNQNYGVVGLIYWGEVSISDFQNQFGNIKMRLYDKENNVVRTTLNIKGRWLSSKSTGIQSEIDEKQMEINITQSDRVVILNDLNSIYKTFIGLEHFAQSEYKGEHGHGKGDVKYFQPFSANEPQIKNVERRMTVPEVHQDRCVSQIILYSMLLYFIISLWNNNQRCVFLDLSLSLLYLCSAFTGLPEMNRAFVWTLIVGFCTSIALDIVWLQFYWTPWRNENYIDNGSLNGVRSMITIACIVLLGLKVGVTILLCMLVCFWIKDDGKMKTAIMPDIPKILQVNETFAFNEKGKRYMDDYKQLHESQRV